MQSPTCKSCSNEPWRLWLESREGRVKPSSYSTYSRAAERHLRELPWDSLTQEDISAVLEGDGLAPATRRLLATVLRRTLSYVDGSFSVRLPPDSPPRVATLTDEDAVRLMRYLAGEGGTVSAGILLAVCTGLRIGEICALRWEDISLARGTVSVRRTVQRIKNPEPSGPRTALYFGEPKSRSGNRVIPLPASLLGLLARHEAPGPCYLLTGSERVCEPRTLQYRFKRILRDAQVPEVNFHALRHTFATRAIDSGMDVKTLSLILGHSDVQTTMNIYVHPSLTHMRECIELLAPAQW